jgi:type I restriction enzyme, S subunit
MNAERLLAHYERIADAPDAIPRLRRVVLDLAVRGKLVPQDPRDEPLELNLLRRELDRKQPVGRTGADLGPVTLDELPVDIPSSWRRSRLFQLCVQDAPIVYGILQPGPDVRPEGVPYIRPSEIDQRHIVLANIRHTTREIANQYSRASIQADDLILTIVGTIGAVAIVPKELNGGNITQSSCRLRVDPRLIERNFLMQVLRSGCVIEQIDRMKLGTAVPRLNIAHVRAIAIPLPPLAEQRRIVAKVDELMALCDRLEAARAKREATRDRLTASSLARLNAPDPDPDTFADGARFALGALSALTTRPNQIKHLRQTILNLAVRGKLVPQDPKDEPASELLKRIAKEKARLVTAGKVKKEKPLDPIDDERKPFATPDAWEWVRLDVLTQLITKGSSPKWQGVRYVTADDGILFITSENAGSYGLRKLDDLKYVEARFREIEPRSMLKTGDILMNLVGASIGRTALYDLRAEANINQAVALVRLIELHNGPSVEYLLHYLNSPSAIHFMLGSRVTTAQPNMGLTDAREFPVPLPPLAEQHRIVAKVDALMALCDQLEASLTVAADTRRRLLEALLAEALAPNEERECEAAE